MSSTHDNDNSHERLGAGGNNTSSRKRRTRELQRQDLKGEFGHLKSTLRTASFHAASIASGPVAVKLLRAAQHGRAWVVKLAGRSFKISIEDGHACTIQDAMRMVELTPEPYRRGLEIVSEAGKDGVALYNDLDGSVGHGSQNYINLIGTSVETILHELGHCIEQRA
jgi:hypothetical protein